jgi:hypothetical protein
MRISGLPLPWSLRIDSRKPRFQFGHAKTSLDSLGCSPLPPSAGLVGVSGVDAAAAHGVGFYGGDTIWSRATPAID